MEHDRALTTVRPQEETVPIVLGGATSLEEAIKQQTLLNNFVASQMKQGTDYGIIPGTKRKSLYKPGAEKLLFFNGLGIKLEIGPNTVVDWKEGFWNYEYKAVAFHKRTGTVVAECYGSANSKENRYAWRWVSEKKIPRGMKKEDLVSEKKSGDHGEYMAYRIPNEDLYTVPNTLQKMAQKRAINGVAILACRASENFTTDVEEEDADHTAKDTEKKAEPAGKGEPAKKEAPKADTSGWDVSQAITEGKLKRLYAIMKEIGVTEAHLKEYVGSKYPYTIVENEAHLSRIRWKNDYDEIVKWVESNQ